MKKLLLALALILTLSSCASSGAQERAFLEESLALGTSFMLNNQNPEGNFTYEYNFLNQSYTEGDNQVRQAGALWGVALIHKNMPTEATLQATLDGLAFFDSISKTTEEGYKYVTYDDGSAGKSGTIALINLALIELLQTDYELPNREFYEEELEKYFGYLLSLRQSNGLFHKSFSFDSGEAYGANSPYVDGEALLAMIKFYKIYPSESLGKLINNSALAMHQTNVIEALDEDPDSDTTKGFFQWGIMSFYELYNSDLRKEKYADWSIELAHWMIDVHRTLDRTRNTAYAYEGIISAYELAKTSGKNSEVNKFKAVIDEGLKKLTSWQVGSSIQNEYLQRVDSSDPLALGGVMNKKDEPLLRIDVTQHQMHAVILALKYVY